MMEHMILGTTSKYTKGKTRFMEGKSRRPCLTALCEEGDLLGEGSATDIVYVDFSKASGILSNILRDKQRKNSLDKWTVEWPDNQLKHRAPSSAGDQSLGPYPRGQDCLVSFLMKWMMGREQAQQVHSPYKTRKGGWCSGGLCCHTEGVGQAGKMCRQQTH